MTIAQRIELLKQWCNGKMVSQLDDKHNFEIRDLFPYKTVAERPNMMMKIWYNLPFKGAYEHVFHCPPIGSNPAYHWKPKGKHDKMVHNVGISYRQHLTHITFEDFLNKNCPA